MGDSDRKAIALRRRSAISFLVVAAAAGLSVLLFRESFHDRALPLLGLSPAAGDAAIAVAIVLVAYLANRAAQRSIDLTSHDRQRQSFLAAAGQVSHELAQVQRYNQVVRGQLQTIVGETETAACDIASRLQTIDSVVGELNELAESTTAVSQEAMMARMLEGSGRLADMFMTVMASVQFQDVTRQQVEQVVDALDRLDAHVALLGERLHKFEDPGYEFQPLAEHLEQMYEGYVMDSQRESHASALGAAAAAPAGGQRKIELF